MMQGEGILMCSRPSRQAWRQTGVEKVMF